MFFGKNEYKPHTKEGKKLIGHELTHVVQQEKTSKNQIQIKRKTIKAKIVLNRKWLDKNIPFLERFILILTIIFVSRWKKKHSDLKVKKLVNEYVRKQFDIEVKSLRIVELIEALQEKSPKMLVDKKFQKLIKLAQKNLKKDGLISNKPDGLLGKGTMDALHSFQWILKLNKIRA